MPERSIDQRRIEEVLRAIEARIDDLSLAREALADYQSDPTPENLSRFNRRFSEAYGLPSFIRGNVLTFEHESPELEASRSLTHRDVIVTLNHAIERLQRTEPADDSPVAAVILELDFLCGQVIGSHGSVAVDAINTQLEAALAKARVLLGDDAVAPATQTLPSPS